MREALGERSELSGDVTGTLYAVRERLEEIADEFINLTHRPLGRFGPGFGARNCWRTSWAVWGWR